MTVTITHIQIPTVSSQHPCLSNSLTPLIFRHQVELALLTLESMDLEDMNMHLEEMDQDLEDLEDTWDLEDSQDLEDLKEPAVLMNEI